MAAPAAARVQEPRRDIVFGMDSRQVVSLILQLLLFAYGYGQLKQSVDGLHERITIIENDLRTIAQRK